MSTYIPNQIIIVTCFIVSKLDGIYVASPPICLSVGVGGSPINYIIGP